MKILSMKTAALGLALGAMLGAPGQGVAQTSLSLAEAQEQAIEKAYAMERALIDVEVAKRDVKELLATGLPQVTGSVDFNHFVDIPTQVVPASSFDPSASEDMVLEFSFGTTQSLTAGLNATQLIFSGSYLVGVQAAKVLADAKDLAVERTAVETRRMVAESYATALAARANVATLDKALRLVAQSESELRAMAEEGFLESVDADRLTLTRQTLEQQLGTARLQAELTAKLLLFQCGLPVNSNVELTDALEELTQAKVPAAVQAQLNLSTVPSLQEQQQYLALAELDVKNRRAEGLPQIAGFYSTSQQAFRDPDFPVLEDQNNWYPNQIVGLSMSMPVWTSFGGRQRVEKAKLQVLNAQSGYRQMVEATKLEFDNAKATFLDAEAALRNARQQRDLASRILERIESGHKEGVRSSFELNDAQNQLIESEGNLIGAQLAWLNAQQRLIASNPQP